MTQKCLITLHWGKSLLGARAISAAKHPSAWPPNILLFWRLNISNFYHSILDAPSNILTSTGRPLEDHCTAMDASRIVEALTHHRALRSNPATFNETPIGNNTSQCVSLSGEQMATFLQIQHQTLWPRKNVIICSHSFRRIPTHGHWIGRNSSAHKSCICFYNSTRTTRRFQTETTTDSVSHKEE